MNKNKLSTQPIKGFRDFVPEKWAVQQYIFDVWRKVCLRYGYEEYNGPILEYAEIYNKSGDDVGTQGKELYTFVDQGGRKLAIRPEMTPTVGRMVAEYGGNYTKPIRWFSIAQFFRAEKPQRGRGREFFQLNVDVFGDESVSSDFEIASLVLEIMLEFGATEKMFLLKINDRKFTDFYLKNELKINDQETIKKLMRIVDAYPKKDEKWLDEELGKLGVSGVREYLNLKISDLSKYPDSEGAKELIELFDMLEKSGFGKYVEFDTTITRGFDYYTGVVFEVFDKDPLNNRSMFGGGRYDDLLDIFGKEKMPAVGAAPGDVTTGLFLETWGLIPEKVNQKERYYLPLLSEDLKVENLKIASNIRKGNKTVITSLKVQDLTKALRTADKSGYEFVIIFGQDEKAKKKYKIKNMKDGSEKEYDFLDI